VRRELPASLLATGLQEMLMPSELMSLPSQPSLLLPLLRHPVQPSKDVHERRRRRTHPASGPKGDSVTDSRAWSRLSTR